MADPPGYASPAQGLRQRHADLGRAVSLQQLFAARDLRPPFGDGHRHRGGPADAQPQPGRGGGHLGPAFFARHGVVRLDQTDVHGGHAHEHRRRSLLPIDDDPPPLRRGELGAERHLRAVGVRAHPRVHDAVHVVQRQRVKDLIFAAPTPRLRERIDLRGERRVRVQRGFGRAGGAAGEDDEGAVVGFGFGTRRQVVARCRVAIARDVVDVSQAANVA
mmetsp:Transcript_5200/g.21301  ORF Transcript_5200/g.21301 Transcript_5200/m.21301 type:complete len:218 (-) Transcript_5200:395-1048(-)